MVTLADESETSERCQGKHDEQSPLPLHLVHAFSTRHLRDMCSDASNAMSLIHSGRLASLDDQRHATPSEAG